MSNNVIKSLPESFGSMFNLTELIMQKCSLESIPKSFDKLTKMEILNLGSNNIKEIDVNLFGKMDKLRELTLNSNKLEALPNISVCSALIKLNIAENKIKLIEKEKLVELDNL
jgi:Leucine-rich repeat (LRR) protein